MPILAIGQALRRQKQLNVLDWLVDEYDRLRASDKEDKYDIALRNLRSIFFHSWRILLVRREHLSGSGTGSYRTIFNRKDVTAKLVSLLQIYHAILVAQAEEVGDFEDFETNLFALIGGIYRAGFRHIHHEAYPRPKEGWSSVTEYHSYMANAEAMRNPSVGKIGLYERDLTEGAVELLFEPKFTVTLPGEETGEESEHEKPLAEVLNIAVGTLESDEEDEVVQEPEKKFSRQPSRSPQKATTNNNSQQDDQDNSLLSPPTEPKTSAFATSTLRLTPRPPKIRLRKTSKSIPDLPLPPPEATQKPDLRSPQQRKQGFKLRLFRNRSSTPAQQSSSTPPQRDLWTPSPKNEGMELGMEVDVNESMADGSVGGRSARVKRETGVMMGWKNRGPE